MISVSPIGERQSVGGAMIFTVLMAARMAIASSLVIFSGFLSPSTFDFSRISVASLSVILEKSFLRNALTVFWAELDAYLRMSPISMPSGWGLISFGLGGIMSVALSNTYLVPSGSWNVISAWGLTMAVSFRYSNTDCFPVMYLPLMVYSILVPCSLPSHVKALSLVTIGRLVLVSMTMSMPHATSSSPSILDMTWAGLPVVMLPYITVAEIPIPCCPLDCLRAWNLDP